MKRASRSTNAPIAESNGNLTSIAVTSLPLPKHFMTVDPGVGGTAIAEWKSIWTTPKTMLFELGKDEATEDWLTRAHFTAHQFQTYIKLNNKPEAIYIEYPQVFVSAGGMASATRGDVMKLMFLVGALAQICWDEEIEFRPLEVRTWKGTLPKDVVMNRIERILNARYQNHVADAVGMGLFLKGEMDATGQIRVHEEE